MRTTSAPSASPRPTCTIGDVIDPPLQVQAGSQLDLAADAERVDRADRRSRSRRAGGSPPSVRLRPVLGRARRLRVRGRARSARAGRRRRDRRRAVTPSGSAAGSGVNDAAGSAEQDARGARAGGDQIRGAVVVEIGGRGVARRPARSPAAARRADRGVAFHVPSRASRASRVIAPSPAEHDQVEDRRRRVVRARRSPTARPARRGSASCAEGSAALVQEHVDARRLIEKRGVRHALAVQVGPRRIRGRACTPANRSRGVNVPSPLLRRTIGMRRRARATTRSRSPSVSTSAAQHAGGRRVQQDAGSFASGRDVGEAPAGILPQQAESARTGDRRDRCGSRSSDRRPPRRRRSARPRRIRCPAAARCGADPLGDVDACGIDASRRPGGRRQSSEIAPIQ